METISDSTRQLIPPNKACFQEKEKRAGDVEAQDEPQVRTPASLTGALVRVLAAPFWCPLGESGA